MKTILAAFMALGVVLSTGILAAGTAQAAYSFDNNRTTVSGNAAG
jgi:hypothetical protein